MTGASGKFCQCTTTEKCGGGMGSTAICSTTDSICMTKCGSSADCGGRTCDTATGECLNSTSTLGKPCSSTAAQPDICDNGQFCTGTSPVCTVVPAPTCANFTTSGTPHGTNWLSANNAPVIYDISRQLISSTDGFCTGGGVHFVARVRAYWKGGSTLPTTNNGMEGVLHYVRSDGSECAPPSCMVTVTNTNTTTGTGGQNTVLDAHFCRPSGSTTLTIGLHFVAPGGASGNEACGTIQ